MSAYDLEVLTRIPHGERRSTPLLFVHGAHSAAWCWEAHFLPWFAEQGYEAIALSLRGHGGSDGADHLSSASLDDYADDVKRVAGACRCAPVLIGHSMGAAVVQRCLRDRAFPGAVLMAPVPPHGLMGSAWGLTWRRPRLFAALAQLQVGRLSAANVEAIRAALVSSRTPDEVARAHLRRMQHESQRVVFDLSWTPFGPGQPLGGPPVLVLGGDEDGLVMPVEVEACARYLDVEARILPGASHLMMLGAEWPEAAEALRAWLAERVS